jgi:hypothetical protein
MGAVRRSAFVRHRTCSTYHGEFNISVSNNYFTAKMPNILKNKTFKKRVLERFSVLIPSQKLYSLRKIYVWKISRSL